MDKSRYILLSKLVLDALRECAWVDEDTEELNLPSDINSFVELVSQYATQLQLENEIIEDEIEEVLNTPLKDFLGGVNGINIR